MQRKIVAVLSLVLILSFGFTLVAEAAEVAGTGTLLARGAGYAEVHGDGVLDIAARGVGVVRVRGAEVLRAQGRGRRWDLPDGTTVFAGWRGHVHVEGHEMNVQMLGGVVEFSAKGSGWVLLRGRGQYRANGEQGRWTSDGVRIELAPAADTP